jgi:hypothetical protein
MAAQFIIANAIQSIPSLALPSKRLRISTMMLDALKSDASLKRVLNSATHLHISLIAKLVFKRTPVLLVKTWS